MLKEFKKFIMTGNVIDLAIAVLLAGAIGLVVKGFVSDIMMPIIVLFIQTKKALQIYQILQIRISSHSIICPT